MMEEKFYCIYTGQYILNSESSIEHIIPLSLGGADRFTISVDRELNSIAGRTVDANMANDFLVRMNTIRKGYRGHSKNEPVLKVKKAKIKDSPVSVHFKKKGMEIYDPIKKRIVNEGASVQMETKMGLDTRIKFTSKVALAAGYFAYSDIFINYADHERLREFVFSENIQEESFSDLKFYDPFTKVKDADEGMHSMFKYLIKALGGSSVILSFSESSIIVYVGIGGEYIGTVNFKADSKKFAMDDENRLGKVFQCKDNQLLSGSLWKAIYDFNKAFGIVEIDDSGLDI